MTSNNNSKVNMQAGTSANSNDDWEITSVNNIDVQEVVDNSVAPSLQSLNGIIVIDLDWMKKVFPTKDEKKIESWISILQSHEFDTVDSLLNVKGADWDRLGLPLGVISQLQAYLEANPPKTSDVSAFGSSVVDLNQPRPISQIDCVVIDISGSMTETSKIDCDKTREDVSKMLFHTLIDKLITLELSHAVGLLAFGSSLTPIGITTEYERFHDELGRLDANQGSTMLYDAIYNAAEIIDTYHLTHIVPDIALSTLGEGEVLKKRIFVLTDGEDNSSTKQPWEVANFLQQKNIQLDAIPLAGPTKILQSICTASGGICFEVQSQEQGINLFEREATLHLAYRERIESVPPMILNSEMLRKLESAMEAPVLEIKSAIPQSVYAPVLSASDVAKKESASVTMPGSMRRVIKEYMQIVKDPIPSFSVYMSAEDSTSWKLLLTDLPAPYTGGTWLLTANFSSSFPFQAPKIKFVTPIYHCNISVDGNICLDALKQSWSPAISVGALLLNLRELLLEPNGHDPLDAYKGALYRDYITEGKADYFREASAHTMQYASESVDSLKSKYHLEE